VLQWLPWLVLPIVAPQALMYAVLGGAALGLMIVVWWLFFSRAPWIDRVGALVLMPSRCWPRSTSFTRPLPKGTWE
jgi:hypothetical protein